MIYLDNSATTKCYDSVLKILEEFNHQYYFNPSAPYSQALDISRKIENARTGIAEILGCFADEIYFTSCATESNNAAIFGAHKNKKGVILTTEGEHPSIYNVLTREKSKGGEVIFLPINQKGIVDFAKLESSLAKIERGKISLVSIIHVSNEVGAINDIAIIAKIIKEHSPKSLFHSDGVQAVGKISVDIHKLGVDLYSLSGHKFHAPKGIGALFVKRGLNIAPLLAGGGQERGVRSGTENVAGIVSLFHALDQRIKEYDANHMRALKNMFLQGLNGNGVKAYINSDDDCISNIISVSFEGIRGEVLLHTLAKRGILVGAGSACSSKRGGNRVLESMGKSRELINGSIRLSFDEWLTLQDAKSAVEIIVEEVQNLKK